MTTKPHENKNSGAHHMGMDAELTGLSVLTELLSSSSSRSSMLSCPAQVVSRRLRTRGRIVPLGPCQGNIAQGLREVIPHGFSVFRSHPTPGKVKSDL